jgi:acetyl-CoA C-acetyltransferase
MAGGFRTPFGKYGGAIRTWSAMELGSYLVPRALQRMGIDPDAVDHLVCATAVAAEIANNFSGVARRVAIDSGLVSVPSYTMDCASASGLAAVKLAHLAVSAGEAEVAIALGTEAMGNAAFVVSPRIRWGNRGDLTLVDPIFPLGGPTSRAARATGPSGRLDEEAPLFNVTRAEMDNWAYTSQMRYEKARAAGLIDEEMIAIEADGTPVLAVDEAAKPWSTLEKLATLPTVRGSQYVTAGNSPGLESGAALVVLMSRAAAERLGFANELRLTDAVFTASDPAAPLVAAGVATKKLLDTSGVRLRDVDLVEIEEDYAAAPIIAARYLAAECDVPEADLLERTNVNGGAVVMGHPIATGGTRIALHLAREMKRRNSRLGVAAVAGAMAQGTAILLRHPA